MRRESDLGGALAGGEISLAGGALRSGADGGAMLVGGRCHACDTRTFPAYAVCPRCMGEDVGEEAMPRRGVVYAATTVHVGPQRWPKPFVVGYVDLANGVRLFAHLRGDPPIGAEVELDHDVVGRDPDGTPVTSFVFRAVAA